MNKTEILNIVNEPSKHIQNEMEIVIKISEKLYNRMKTYQGLDDTYVAVKHGTPLPKVHGDLIDKSLLYPDSDYDDGLFYAVSIGQINDAPVIIKGKSEDEE